MGVVTVLGAIGTAGILHSSGVIQSLPQSFSWIANMGTAAHGVVLGAAGLSIFAIAAGGVKCHRARMLENRTERRASSPPPSAASALVWREETIYTTKYAAIPLDKYAIYSKTTTDTDLIIRRSADGKIVCCTIAHSTLQATLHSLDLKLTKDEFTPPSR
ncbi:MAG: hypothetical protein JSR97_10280 [Verrucomicrobia bacterium]|nr:hypothetical protein [Verrucomicrobiota bacterium]